MDSFIQYLYSVEESCETLTADQFQKLCLIQTRVTELVDKVNLAFTQPVSISLDPNKLAQVQELQPIQLSEKTVICFYEFISEKIEKKANCTWKK